MALEWIRNGLSASTLAKSVACANQGSAASRATGTEAKGTTHVQVNLAGFALREERGVRGWSVSCDVRTEARLAIELTEDK